MEGVDVALTLPRISPLAKERQATIGLTLAGAVVVGWLALHLYAMFGFRPRGIEWLAAPLLAVALCWLSVGLFIVAHDAMHGSLAPGRPKLNRAVGRIMLMLYAGFSYDRLTSAHWRHHKAPGSADDPDFAAAHPDRFWPWYGTFLRRYFGWGPALFTTAMTGGYFFLGIPVANLLLLYALPAIASSLQLFYFGTYRPHRHDDKDFADRHRSRSNGWGTLASLASCYHFGYHHEHHLSPEVPWWRLPERRRAGLAAMEGERA